MDETPPNGDTVAAPGWRTCEACGVPKALKSFRQSKAGVHDYICRGCRQKLKQKQKLEKLESRACENFLTRANDSPSGGSNIPHTSEMLESIMTLFGGTQGFASMLASQYHAAPAGGRIRNSILEMVTRLTVKVAESGATRAPVSLMSDEELEVEINKRLESAVLTVNGGRVLGIEKVEGPIEEEIPDGGRSLQAELMKVRT